MNMVPRFFLKISFDLVISVLTPSRFVQIIFSFFAMASKFQEIAHYSLRQLITF